MAQPVKRIPWVTHSQRLVKERLNKAVRPFRMGKRNARKQLALADRIETAITTKIEAILLSGDIKAYQIKELTQVMRMLRRDAYEVLSDQAPPPEIPDELKDAAKQAGVDIDATVKRALKENAHG